MNEGMKRRDGAGVETLAKKLKAEANLLSQLQVVHRTELVHSGTLQRAESQAPVPRERLRFDQAVVGVRHESIGEHEVCERLVILVPQHNTELPACGISVLTIYEEGFVSFDGFTNADIQVVLRIREELLSAAHDEGLLPHLDASLTNIQK